MDVRSLCVLLGLIIGAVSGAAQVWMLARFTKAITGGGLDKITVLYGVCQFFLPLIVLLGCAFIIIDSLIWAAIGMAVILVGFSFIKFMLPKK